MQQVSWRHVVRSEKELARGSTDKDGAIRLEMCRRRKYAPEEREKERTRAQWGPSENRTHIRNCTWLQRRVNPLSLSVPRVSHPVRRFVGRRRAPSLTRTELCHRDALYYEVVIQHARENMRWAMLRALMRAYIPWTDLPAKISTTDRNLRSTEVPIGSILIIFNGALIPFYFLIFLTAICMPAIWSPCMHAYAFPCARFCLQIPPVSSGVKSADVSVTVIPRTALTTSWITEWLRAP